MKTGLKILIFASVILVVILAVIGYLSMLSGSPLIFLLSSISYLTIAALCGILDSKHKRLIKWKV